MNRSLAAFLVLAALAPIGCTPHASTTAGKPLLADRAAEDRLGYRIQWQTDLGLRGAQRIQRITLLDAGVLVLEQGNVLSLLDNDSGLPRWRRAVAAPVDRISKPAVYRDHLVVCSDSQLYALRIDNGQLADTFPLAHHGHTTPHVLHGQVILGTPEGLVFAQAMHGGFTTWRYRMKAAISVDPLADAGNLFIADEAGQVAGLNPLSGNVVWRRSQPPWGPITAQPVASGTFAFAACTDQKLYAFDRASGTIFWSFGTQYPLTTPPAVIADRVYQRTRARGLVCLDLLDGSVIWESRIAGQPAHLRDKQLLLVDGATLRIVNVDTGQPLDEITLPHVQQVDFSATERGNLYLTNRDGRIMKLAPR